MISLRRNGGIVHGGLHFRLKQRIVEVIPLLLLIRPAFCGFLSRREEKMT